MTASTDVRDVAALVPRSLAPLVCSKAERLRARRRRLCFDRLCRCQVCAARRGIMAVRDLVPGELPFSPEAWALHKAENALSLVLWHALVSRPEAAAEAAKHRPDDRATGSAWSILLAELAALGVLRDASVDPDPHRNLAHWLEVCPHTGPPAFATAARWSTLRTAAHGMGAPVIGP